MSILWVVQALLDVILLILLVYFIGNRRERMKLKEMEVKMEEFSKFMVSKAKELKELAALVEYEKDLAIEEIRKKQVEFEKKLKMMDNLLKEKENESRRKKELVKKLLKLGKTPEEISRDLKIPVSEVKFFKDLIDKTA